MQGHTLTLGSQIFRGILLPLIGVWRHYPHFWGISRPPQCLAWVGMLSYGLNLRRYMHYCMRNTRNTRNTPSYTDLLPAPLWNTKHHNSCHEVISPHGWPVRDDVQLAAVYEPWHSSPNLVSSGNNNCRSMLTLVYILYLLGVNYAVLSWKRNNVIPFLAHSRKSQKMIGYAEVRSARGVFASCLASSVIMAPRFGLWEQKHLQSTSWSAVLRWIVWNGDLLALGGIHGIFTRWS